MTKDHEEPVQAAGGTSDGTILENAVACVGSAYRLGVCIITLPINLLPKQPLDFIQNAVKGLTNNIVRMPIECVSAVSNQIERWTGGAGATTSATSTPSVPPVAQVAVQQQAVRVRFRTGELESIATPAPPAPPAPAVAAPPAPPVAQTPPTPPAPPAAPAVVAAPPASASAPTVANNPPAQTAKIGPPDARMGLPPAPAAPAVAATLPTATPAAEKPADASKKTTAAIKKPIGTAETPAAAPVAPPSADTTGVKPVAVAAPVAPKAAPAITGVDIEFIEFEPRGNALESENVWIHNTTTKAVDMTGWVLRSGAKYSFTFPAFTLAPDAMVIVWTKAGKNDAENLYWGNRSAVWTNKGDAGTLSDAAGNRISEYNYGGK